MMVVVRQEQRQQWQHWRRWWQQGQMAPVIIIDSANVEELPLPSLSTVLMFQSHRRHLHQWWQHR
jgi:hypothetical protein